MNSGGARPITCAFGTRLDPAELIAGLDAVGLVTSQLVLEDGGLVLACPDPDPRRDDVARALTWLRSRFSPLVPMRAALLAGGTATPRVRDERTRAWITVALAEATDPSALPTAIDDLLARLEGAAEGSARPTAGAMAVPDGLDPPHASAARGIAAALGGRLAAIGASAGDATLSALMPSKAGMMLVGAARQEATVDARGPHVLFWFRRGTEREGVRPALLVAASWHLEGLRRLGGELRGDAPRTGSSEPEVLIDGLVWKVARRPTVAVPPLAASLAAEPPIRVDPARCTACGLCAEVCPTGFLGPRGVPVAPDAAPTPPECIRCYDCVEACPTDALRPVRAADASMRLSALAHREGWLSRLTGAPGPSFPAPFPPSYLLPRKASATRPRYVLGLAIMTMQEHAAVLLDDGEVVGAIEQERLTRVRHAGWHPPDRPGVTPAVDPTICLEEALCRRPIRALLEQAGITLDDVDLFAVNGLHGRYVGQISFIDPTVPIPTIRAGRVVHLPHHLCHAASAYRLSGAPDAWVLTVDGRGDRECAALFRAEGGELRAVDTILALTDRSIGGVYEGVTRLLGFGGHGQGSVMALASFGTPEHDMSPFLRIDEDGGESVHESGVDTAFASLARGPLDALGRPHQDLAASLQAALEAAAIAFVRRSAGPGPLDALCVAGGVALNCRMNERLRRTFAPGVMFAQPGANDAGTAFGAALEAWARASGERTRAPLQHAYLGPAFSDDEIERVLRRSGLRYQRVDAVATEAAQRLAAGQVVCWFQGRMEFGPRALGARSILADPRDAAMHARVNRLKEREAWRPFGPMILAGHESEWLDGAFDARFMLFTLPVREDKRAAVPAIVHVDGTTRPQVVHRETSPLLHAVLASFHARTGVPLLLNTSFNRRGEPIVCTPADALESFLGLGADVLAIGSFLVERERAAPVAEPVDAELAALPGGRRLSLRLTTACDFDCGHCTLRDQHGRADRSADDALRALAEGRRAACDELVILRGEAALRPDLPELVARARRMGYRFVQLQTNAHALADLGRRERVLGAGVDAFEVMLVAADEALHDELTDRVVTLRATAAAIQALVRSGRRVLVTVPVLARNLRSLGSIVALAGRLGVRAMQFNFPRPVELPDRVVTAPLARLSLASQAVRAAARAAQQAGMKVSTEAFPFCHLPPELRDTPDATEDWRRHRVDDLHVLQESFDDVRRTNRTEAAPCRGCSARDVCPKTWALYLELFGSDELKPLDDAAGA